MRVSTQQIYSANVDNLNSLNSTIAKVQEQISSGERFTQPSEDPLAASQVLKLDQEIARYEQYQDNIEVSQRRLELEETTLEAINDASVRLQEIVTQAGNGTLSSEDLGLLASEVGELINEIDSLVNTKDSSGEYLFSGYQGLTRTYDYNEISGEYEFQGDGGQRYIQVGPDFQVASTDSALDIFEGATGAYQPILTDITDPLNSTVVESSFFSAYVSDYTEFEEFDQESSAVQLALTAAVAPADAQVTLSYTDADGTAQSYVYTLTEVDGEPVLSADTSQSNAEAAAALINDNGDGLLVGGLELLMADTALSASDTSVALSGEYESDNILNYALDIYNALENAGVESYEGSLEMQQSLASALIALDNIQAQNISARASIGARVNAIEDQESINDDYILYTETTRSALADTDMTEAASELALLQTQLEASYSSFNIITGLSLFNYIN